MVAVSHKPVADTNLTPPESLSRPGECKEGRERAEIPFRWGLSSNGPGSITSRDHPLGITVTTAAQTFHRANCSSELFLPNLEL